MTGGVDGTTPGGCAKEQSPQSNTSSEEAGEEKSLKKMEEGQQRGTGEPEKREPEGLPGKAGDRDSQNGRLVNSTKQSRGVPII